MSSKDFLELAKNRRSIRAYRKDPVPGEKIVKLLEAARWAPSGANIQPWDFYVVTGSKREGLVEHLTALKNSPEKPFVYALGEDEFPDHYPPVSRERVGRLRKEMGEQFAKAGITDRSEFTQVGSFRFFDAPVVIIVTSERALGAGQHISVGAAIQNILLAAEDEGLATCWIAMWLQYADEVRKYLEIPEDKNIIGSISLGYADMDTPVNDFRSSRADQSEIVKWMGDDQ